MNRQPRKLKIPKPDHPTLDPNPAIFERCDLEFLRAFFDVLKNHSAGTVSELCEWNHERHSHAINFERTTEPEGFPHLDDQAQPEEFWQFAIAPGKPWRVHGFFTSSTFQIVWLDPLHELDP
jgi:hypothetical protein